MRYKLIMYFKTHPRLIMSLWMMARYFLQVCSWFVPVQRKTIIFNSFGGRGFNDSPKAIYDEICRREEFNDWRLIWAFVNPEEHEIPRGEKVKIDTLPFFHALLYSHVWVGNSDTDRGIGLKLSRTIRVDTWHGCPLKRICGEENTATFVAKPEDYRGSIDSDTIRCAQSEYDRDIFARLFHASKDSFLLCDLPRNDEITKYSEDYLNNIRISLGISSGKKVILYTPTYREYLLDDNNNNYITPPINLSKWEKKLSGEFVLLIRAHYAVTSALNINENAFVKDVSSYPSINELYAISDMMISDYSSTFFDYAILDRPMFCFAYDQEEYESKRGLYLNLDEDLPCTVDKDEDSLIEHILHTDYNEACLLTKKFHERFAPHAGNASEIIVNEILLRLTNRK